MKKDLYISIFAALIIAVILTSGFAFAESGKEASSITFLPTVNSYDIEEVQVKDDDGDSIEEDRVKDQGKGPEEGEDHAEDKSERRHPEVEGESQITRQTKKEVLP